MNGYWRAGSNLDRAHCLQGLLALQRKVMLSLALNVALTSLCYIAEAWLVATKILDPLPYSWYE